MRNNQIGFVEHDSAVQNEIEVERPRSFRNRPLASALAFDSKECLQDRSRRQRRGTGGGRVQVERLGTVNIDGYCLVKP